MRDSALFVVQAFGTQVEADFARSMLESAGIDAVIQADRAGGMRDHLAWSGFGFKVLVREEDAAAAREVLDPPRMAPEGNLVVAQVCGTQAEADVVRGALESAGIAAAIVAEAIEDKNSMFFRNRLLRVMVREEDASAAREVLQQSDEPGDADE
jgi:F420-dependent methylenetetrahydromethanopterin dehydrogenase